MKLAIIGGGGVRVPLLVHGLIRRGLPFDRIALFDTDGGRLETIARLTAARAPSVQVKTSALLPECVTGADFVVTSIRVGGLAARERDEATALRHGVVGQETVGPAGFAMAVRTIPVITDYARAIARYAPAAWVINFTNPVGIITQAMRRAADVRTIGICDTPTELFAEIAHALALPVADCTFDYVGLNHLGWVRGVMCDGKSRLEPIWSDPAVLSRIYSRPLFPVEFLAQLRLLPTEYVYYYEFPERAVERMRAAGTSRGAVVSALTDQLFASLRRGGGNPLDAYERYLEARSGSYMQIESGQLAPHPPSPWAELTGYDRIAFDVISAIVHDSRAVIPLNVDNCGNIPELQPDDVIEVPCVVGGGGPEPRRVGPFPVQVRDLATRVKTYERLAIEAARSMRRDDLIAALASNPLVTSSDLAARLVDALTLR